MTAPGNPAMELAYEKWKKQGSVTADTTLRAGQWCLSSSSGLRPSSSSPLPWGVAHGLQLAGTIYSGRRNGPRA